MLRTYITYKEAARISWAIVWRIWLPGVLLLVGLAYTPALKNSAVLLWLLFMALGSLAVIKYLLGRKIGRLRLLIEPIAPVGIQVTDSFLTPNYKIAASLWSSLAWRIIAIQLPIIFVCLPLFLPDLCVMANVLTGSDIPYCDVDGMFGPLVRLNISLHGLPFWIGVQCTWVPVVKWVVGLQLGSFRLVVEDTIKRA